jgi:uncharacterized protein YjbI with pentapeptide repeats
LEDSDLHEADLYACTFTDSAIEGCDLTGAELSKAKMPGVSLRRSDLTDVHGAHGLRGAVIGAEQVSMVAWAALAALGITVADD